MKIALQIVLMIFMVLYLGGGIGAKKTEERVFNLVAAGLLITAIIATIAVL